MESLPLSPQGSMKLMTFDGWWLCGVSSMRLQYLEWEESMGHRCGLFQSILGKIRLNPGQVTWTADKDLWQDVAWHGNHVGMIYEAAEEEGIGKQKTALATRNISISCCLGNKKHQMDRGTAVHKVGWDGMNSGRGEQGNVHSGKSVSRHIASRRVVSNGNLSLR